MIVGGAEAAVGTIGKEAEWYWVRPGYFFYQDRRSVRGTVVDHDDFEVRMRLMRKRVEAGAQEFPAVPVDYYHSDSSGVR